MAPDTIITYGSFQKNRSISPKATFDLLYSLIRNCIAENSVTVIEQSDYTEHYINYDTIHTSVLTCIVHA